MRKSHRLYLVAILSVLALIGCGVQKDSEKSSDPQSKPAQPPEVNNPDITDGPSDLSSFVFTKELQPVGTGGFPIHTEFQISQNVPNGENVQVSFRFHSREFERIQILRETYSGDCSTPLEPPEVSVYPEENPEKAVSLSEVRNETISVQSDTDYILEYRLKSPGCNGLILGATLWMGFEGVQPTLLQACVMTREREDDKILFLRDEGETWSAWTGDEGEIFIGLDRFCGRSVNATGIEMQTDSSSPRVYSATYTDERGMGLGVRVSINPIHRDGSLDCTASGVYLFRYNLSRCYERVLDISEWQE